MSEHATDQAVQVSTEGDVVVVRLDDGKANALSHGIIDAVAAALDDAALAKAMVLIGREGKFSAGFDLSVMTSGPQQARDLLEAGANLAMKAYLSPVPVVFGVTGRVGDGRHSRLGGRLPGGRRGPLQAGPQRGGYRYAGAALRGGIGS